MQGLKAFALNLIDHGDRALGRAGITKLASFADLDNRTPRALYAGRLSRSLPQFAAGSIGLTPFHPSSRNIALDVTDALPLADNYLDIYQAEDVFEHIEYGRLVEIFDDIHRVLKPGGLFRLSVPDYRFDTYARRCLKDEAGNIIFDPGGGGAYRNGHVADGGHLWFPTFELVAALFSRSRFGSAGEVRFLHYTAPDGSFIMQPIDFSLGFIQRVPGNDPRVASHPRPISIVVDAYKTA